MPQVCTAQGCDRLQYSLKFCQKHYARFKKYGTPDGGPTTHAPPEVRFWRYANRTDPDKCWEWTGKRQKAGYGRFGISTENHVGAHRFSFQMANGYLPDLVMHTCDNPPCVNPAHLVAGTKQMNYDDMVAKGRRVTDRVPRGSAHFKARITEADVKAIRASKDSLDALAERYGLKRSGLEKIKYRITWKHID